MMSGLKASSCGSQTFSRMSVKTAPSAPAATGLTTTFLGVGSIMRCG